MQNARKHLGMRTDWWDIEKKLYEILHDSYSVDEFEAEWHNWVQVYGVDGINWVTDMYKDRAKWAPVYFKSKFWAGMSSTQRSEGMNHYLKGFVDINTCLTKFVEEYGKAVCKRAEEEEKDRVLGDDRHSRTTSDHPLEKLFELIYTRDKFIKIHDQLNDAGKMTPSIVRVYDECMVEYDVLVREFRVGWTKRTNFQVIIDRSKLEVKCDCRMFEFSGILCSHMLRVFWEEDTLELPEMYVCKRWRCDIPRKYLVERYPMAPLIGEVAEEVKRYHELHKVGEEICVMVMNNAELHVEAMERLTKLKDEMKERSWWASFTHK